MEAARVYDIFISYRRDGGETMALLLRDRLSAKGYRVFLDVESLNAGKFNTKLLDVIAACQDFLVILSEGCLDRCVNEDDWVRTEIACAFERGKNIIPFILRGFSWPESLPDCIADLPMQNGVNALSNEYFDAVVERLTHSFLRSKPVHNELPILAKKATKAAKSLSSKVFTLITVIFVSLIALIIAVIIVLGIIVSVQPQWAEGLIDFIKQNEGLFNSG